MTNEQNSQKTGGLRPMAGLMQATRVSIQKRSLTASLITSAKDAAETRNELPTAGRDAGGRGAIVTLTARAERLARTFGLPLPKEARLAHSLSLVLDWQEKSLYGDHGFERAKITDVQVRSGADVAGCLEQIEALCHPCGPQFAAVKLAEMRVLTAHRARDGTDIELTATAYTQRLAEYPADVVVAACEAWTNANPFWPAWSELKDRCDRKMACRLELRDALRAQP